MSDEVKIGLYVCTGYGIGDALDVDELIDLDTLSEDFDDLPEVALAKTIESCDPPGLEPIKADIEAEGLNRIVIGGYSPRNVDDPQVFGPDVFVEFVNLREQVIWCHPANDEDTQMMAADYLRMGIAKVAKTRKPEPNEVVKDCVKNLLVVGGGVAGMTAALEAAKTGYEVVLVEKEAELGGYYAKLLKTIPKAPPYLEATETDAEELISAVESADKITVHKGTTIESIQGAPGLFEVKLASGEEFKAGAIVQCTGFKAMEPEGLEHLGWGKDNVVTNMQFEEMAKAGKLVGKDGNPVTSVAFIQCQAKPESEHLSFASSITDLTALKQAQYLREANAESKAYVFFENFRAPGHYELFYKSAQQTPGMFITKGTVTEVSNGGGKLTVKAENTMLDPSMTVDVDMVVLGLGMKPNAADGEAIRQLVDARAVIEKNESPQQVEAAQAKVDALAAHEGTEILKLDYRQGPDLPALEHGYPDSHFVCFPYETRRTGIYAAGCVRQPSDAEGAREDAMGAALKAIQCVEMTARGEAVHPRAGEVAWPDFNLSRCTQCKRCTEECPFGAINEDAKGTPQPNPTRCRRCGTCLGACPERIISFQDFAVTQVAAMIKSISVPDEFDEKPRILCLCCENDAYPAMELAGKHRMEYSPWVRFVPIRCLGSMNIQWVNDAISRGFDAVILMGCKYGEDYQCHYVKGSELANTRTGNIREKLQQMALENERVELHQIQISDYEKIPEIVNAMAEVVDDIGMNPFKGM